MNRKQKKAKFGKNSKTKNLFEKQQNQFLKPLNSLEYPHIKTIVKKGKSGKQTFEREIQRTINSFSITEKSDKEGLPNVVLMIS